MPKHRPDKTIQNILRDNDTSSIDAPSLSNTQIPPKQSENVVIELSDKLYHKYYHAFIDELVKLENVKDFLRDDSIFACPNNIDERHIQYKYKIGTKGETFIYSRDSHRKYEFLIEFDKVETSYGIYYGCRGYVESGNLETEIEIMNREWSLLRGEVCKVLNNTFIDKDFSKRFRPTNNAWDNNYWPFWITLQNDEDIIEVAARATRIIGNLYKKFFAYNENCYKPVKHKVKSVSTLRTAFTKDKYKEVMGKVKERYGKEAMKQYKELIKKGLSKEYKLFSMDPNYEYAIRFNKGITKVSAAAFIGRFCVEQDITTPINGKNTIPWELFDCLFLSADGEPLGALRKLYNNIADRDDLDTTAKIYLEQMGFI